MTPDQAIDDLFGETHQTNPTPLSQPCLRALRPAGGFDLIMADPPWRYEMRSAAGEAKAPQAHYECAPLDWIAALPVAEIAARNCLLWLWALNPMLPQALAVLDAWGFTFKTAGTWVKRTVKGKDAFGTGYVLRGSNEPFLIGTIGAPRTSKTVRSTVASYAGCVDRVEDVPSSVITIEAVIREHSRKPEEAFTAAEALMPTARRVELFSRTNRKGWITWGNEAGKFGGPPPQDPAQNTRNAKNQMLQR